MVTSRLTSLAVFIAATAMFLGYCGSAAAQTRGAVAEGHVPGDELQTRFESATRAYNRGHYETAAKIFGELVQIDSREQWAVASRFYLAEALVQLRRFSEARPFYQEYLATNPRGEHAKFAQFRLGETAFLLDQFHVARQALIAFVQNHGDHDLAGRAQEMLRDMLTPSLDVALREFESWRKCGDSAALASAEGRLSAYLVAYPEDKNHLLARYTLGRVLFEQQRYTQANAVFDKAIDLVATRAIDNDLLANLFAYSGETHLRLGDSQTAATRFEHLLDHWPDSSPAASARAKWADCLVQVAKADIQAGRYDAARKRLSEVRGSSHSCHPSIVDDLLGQCCLRQGDPANARRCWARVLRMSVNTHTESAAKAQWQIAQSYQRQSRYHDAVREYLRLATIFEQRPSWQQQSYVAASECFRELGDTRSAQRMVERSELISKRNSVAKK